MMIRSVVVMLQLLESGDRMLGGQHVIDAADRRVVGSRLHLLRRLAGLLGDLVHHRDEAVHRLLALVLRRLDHQGLVEEQREVDRRRVVAVVEQALGHVHRRDARRFVAQSVEDKLVHAGRP